MASKIRTILTKIFGQPEYRLLILGLDGSGKTGILYRLKLNEFITMIPTIGFNVETITYKNTALTIWDVGGCDKIRPLIRHYFQNTRALIFVVDSQDSDRFEEAKEEFWRIIREDELNGLPILIYLNKIDMQNGLQPDFVIKEMKLTEIRYRKWYFQVCSVYTGDGLYEGLNWLIDAIKSTNVYPPKTVSENFIISTPTTEDNHFEENSLKWLSQVDDDTIEEFIEKLETRQFPVDSFDHREMLRLIWGSLKIHGRKKAVKTIFDDLKAYISDINETLIYFWIQIIHYTQETTQNPTNDFMGFLLMNPQLLNEIEMPLGYYQEDTLFSGQARMAFVLPDVKQLPSIIPSSSNRNKFEKTVNEASNIASNIASNLTSKTPVNELSDDEFLKEFESCTLTNWSHKTHLRMAWLYLTRNERRVAVNKIFDGIKNFILNSPTARKTTFHFTMTYFWIQMIDLAIAQSPKGVKFEEFLSINSHLMNGGLFLEYYKKETLLNNPIARQEMVLPDIRPLPTIVSSSSRKGLKE